MGHQPYALNLISDEDEVTADSAAAAAAATPDTPAEKSNRLGSEPLREGSNKSRASSQTQLRSAAVANGCQHSSARQPSISTFYRRTSDQGTKRQKVEQSKEQKQDVVIDVDPGDGEDELQQAIKNSLAEYGSGPDFVRGDWVWWQRPTGRQFAQVTQMHRFDEEVGTIAELLLVNTADMTPASPADLLPHFFRGQCVLDHTSAKLQVLGHLEDPDQPLRFQVRPEKGRPFWAGPWDLKMTPSPGCHSSEQEHDEFYTLPAKGAVEPAASTPAASGCSTKAAPSCCHSAQQQAPAQRQARCQPARSSGDCQATPERSPAGDDGEEVCQIVGSALKQSAAAAAAAAAGGRLPLGSVHLPIPPLSVEGTQLRGNPANGPQSQPQPCEELPLICGHHPAGGEAATAPEDDEAKLLQDTSWLKWQKLGPN